MLSSAVVEQQICNFREIDKIVGAMKAYAGSAVRKAEGIVRNVRVCEARLLNALAGIVTQHPQMVPGTSGRGKRILVVFGSSVGLCGMFNEKMAEVIAEQTTAHDALLVIGRRLLRLTEARNLACALSFEAPTSFEGIKSALQESLSSIRELYARDEYYSLALVFTTVAKNRGDISLEQVLPPDLGNLASAGAPAHLILTYEQPEAIFSGILEELLAISLYRCYVESLCSENWFRLRAMEGAAENLKQSIAELSSLQNYLRQEETTEEMIEILGSGMFYR